MPQKPVTTPTKLAETKKNLKPNNNKCNKNKQNPHLFTQCTRIKNIWKYFQPIYQKITTQQYSQDQHILMLSEIYMKSDNPEIT